MTKQPSQRIYKALGDTLLSAIGDRPQSVIAQELYVSQAAVHNWLSGKRRPEPGRLGTIAALYNLSPESLASLAGYDSDPDAWDKVLNAYNDRRSASRPQVQR